MGGILSSVTGRILRHVTGLKSEEHKRVKSDGAVFTELHKNAVFTELHKNAVFTELHKKAVFTELHKKLHDFVKTLHFKGWRATFKYKILYKGGFFLIYDKELNKTIASFEILNGRYPLKNGKQTDRPHWKEDPQFPEVDLSCADPYERGHIATFAHHKVAEETRIESCYKTNGFSQISKFHAYRGVEEWATQQFWRCEEVIVITFLEYEERNKPVRVYKILMWKVKTEHIESALTIFRFPNKAAGKCSFDYLETPKALEALPFQLNLSNQDTAYIRECDIEGGNWKSALQRGIKKYNGDKAKATGETEKTTVVMVPSKKKVTKPHQSKKKNIRTKTISPYWDLTKLLVELALAIVSLYIILFIALYYVRSLQNRTT